MTSLAAWVGIDSRSIASLYIASDSRLSWSKEKSTWDFGLKVFASQDAADVFGYWGDVLVPSMILPHISGPGALDGSKDSSARHHLLVNSLESALNTMPSRHRAPFGVIHGSRTDEGRDAVFRLWHTRWNYTDGWIDGEAALVADPKPLISQGTGASFVDRDAKSWSDALGKNVSRSIFSGFCDSLMSGSDALSGGAPQLVGLYRKWNGQQFGIVYKGQRFFRAATASTLGAKDIEWRNELFERCDPLTGKRLTKGQRQPRPDFTYKY